MTVKLFIYTALNGTPLPLHEVGTFPNMKACSKAAALAQIIPQGGPAPGSWGFICVPSDSEGVASDAVHTAQPTTVKNG